MADFNYVPHRVEPSGPEWNTLGTDVIGLPKKTRLKSTKSIRTFVLYFRVQNDSERLNYLNHYKGQKSGLIPFKWTTIPTHISSENSIFVKYISYEEIPSLFSIWEVKITFKEMGCKYNG